ncbi:MAG: TSUP family transporter, partial [Deltaproteobacteria bacterium]|nr:TSUP family transporter [Deltaproteobacteria bacterium]
FVDACGGGGWGPVVTTTLIGSGNYPRWTIGTVNAVEFFVALAASGVFTLFVTLNSWPVILGLIGGGLLAAPLGAYFCKRINVRLCMILVGLLVVLLSGRTLLKLFF